MKRSFFVIFIKAIWFALVYATKSYMGKKRLSSYEAVKDYHYQVMENLKEKYVKEVQLKKLFQLRNEILMHQDAYREFKAKGLQEHKKLMEAHEKFISSMASI